MQLDIDFFHQSLPLAKVFKISRGAKTSAEVIIVVATDGHYMGWGEAVPYGRYGETISSVSQQLDMIKDLVKKQSFDHASLIAQLPAGSARNALDCALWDLACKQQQKTINELIQLPLLSSVTTAQTLSVDSTEIMLREAALIEDAPLIKVKLDAEAVIEKMSAIADICPNSKFIVDANESWTFDILASAVPALADKNVVLIEQPLQAGNDAKLASFDSPIPLCADESCHTSDTFDQLRQRYQSINIKLDKTGGLSEALNLLRLAKAHEMGVMVGCMVASSLAMAPGYAIAGFADYVDLDGPILVATDRKNGYLFDNGLMQDHAKLLWGKPHPENSALAIQDLLEGE